jgi:hypothetical protein
MQNRGTVKPLSGKKLRKTCGRTAEFSQNAMFLAREVAAALTKP